MLDIDFVRENPEKVKENIKKKYEEDKLELVDKVLELDKKWRELKQKGDELRAERNKVSKDINQAKKSGEEERANELIKKAQEIPREIEKNEEEEKKLYSEIKETMMKVPNIIHESVPIGEDDSQNVEKEKYGDFPKFEFQPKNHIDIGENLGMLDSSTSADVAGSGFYYLRSDLGLLNMALINFARDYMTERGFEYTEPPLMIRPEILYGVYSHEEIEEMAYKVEGEDLYLIATSEHPLIGQFIEKTMNKKDLPVKQTAYSMCFRKEIGSHGIEEKGLYRTHQFNKQEMITICEPEESYEWFETMKNYTVDIFRKLEIPVRVLEMCSGDLGALKSKQIDVEAYSPFREDYFEISSLSNMEEAQARRLGIRVQGKEGNYPPHTLNNTVIATSRAIVAILENHQNKDGSVNIPQILRPYMNGKKKIIPKNKYGKKS